MRTFITVVKRVIYLFVLFAMTIYIYIVLGSIETEKPKYQNFLGKLLPVESHLNGYAYLSEAGLVENDFIQPEDLKELKQIFGLRPLDSGFAQRMVVRYEEATKAYKVAAGMPYLRYEVGDDPTELPSYVGLMNGMRLILLEAEFFFVQRRFGEATENLLIAWKFSEKLKRMNGYLISYMIGIASQDEVLKSVQMIASHDDFESEHLYKFIQTLSRVEPFSDSEFKPVMEAELRYFLDYFSAVIDQPFSKRWDIYLEQSSWMTEDESWYSGGKRKLKGILQAFFPKFYIHKNHTLNLMSVELAAVVEWSGVNCDDLDGLVNKEYEWFPKVTLKEIILPNQSYHSLDNHRGTFKEYLIRRCMAFTQIEATKANLAFLLYENLNGGKRADAISGLVPEILARSPTDFMSGQSLNYSPQNQWLYSVGSNRHDDLGSAEACYYKHCAMDEGCKDNPTFPLDLNVCDFTGLIDE